MKRDPLDDPLRVLRREYNDRTYVARILRVVDGDTLDALILLDPESGTWVQRALRLDKAGTPETRGPEYAKGHIAKNAVKDLVARYGKGAVVKIRRGKYAGRILATVHLGDRGSTVNLSRLLIDEGLAKPYGGRGPLPRFPEDEPYPLPADG